MTTRDKWSSSSSKNEKLARGRAAASPQLRIRDGNNVHVYAAVGRADSLH